MSTKNLARTVIEGGRARYNKFERYHSNAVERTHAHQVERALCRWSDDDDVWFEPRQPVYQGFDDKLGPMRRWLRSQVGRPWSKIQGEIFTLFDTRTTAGRHIVYDHLLADVCVDPDAPDTRYADFFVSPRGILKYRGRFGRSSTFLYGNRASLPEPESVLRAWLGARRIAVHGERLYWLVLTVHGGFRQQHELSEADAARFRALPNWFREGFEGPLPAPHTTS